VQSLYRRPLPEQLVAFASPEGRALFREALTDGTMENYFGLAEQHHTQADPTFCGLASLVVALNALAIDPGRLWKGPWRWFSEEQLDCCVPLEHVQANGITLDELACLARCNGATARVYRAEEVQESVLQEAIVSSSHSAAGRVLIASYSRAALGQTGDGHFSPLAGYHRRRNLALVLDVARFKYSPHWVTVGSLFSAMRIQDSATGRSRGFIELERASSPCNLGFVFTNREGGWQRLARFVDLEARQLLDNTKPESARAAIQVVLAAAADAATGIVLRETADAHHQHAVGSVLAQLRETPVFDYAAQDCSQIVPELATVLFYLLPHDTWRSLAPEVTAELVRLGDLERLEQPLSSDVSVLRRQLQELQKCFGT
jgi:glutathione gamma-glutamylcysteinyltransferase